MRDGDEINVGDIENSTNVAIGRGAKASGNPTQAAPAPTEDKEMLQTKQKPIKSAWANGLFYLFVFVVVMATLGVLANSVTPTALIVIIIAGLLFIPVIGAFQLRQDDSLTQKNFLELMQLVIEQLPLIGKFFPGADAPPDTSD